ncbi:MAG: FecR domain-containing protein [Gammaproteobacteria bacterium]|nr:FecR domain-containing protein [Gammaproteobacteria bacterium]
MSSSRIKSLAIRVVWVLAGLIGLQPVLAAAPDAAGQVIVASGTVQALTATGEQRTLRRRSPFYAGEIVRTAAASAVQLRFSDGALMSLRADSELKVDDYRFQNHGGAGDRSMSTLIKGGLRTITGVIGKQDPTAYQLSTPVATIGVRGTHYEAVLESPKSLVLAAWQGGIRVRNEQGIIDLGMGADYNFARAEAAQSPRGLLEPPPILQNEAPVGHAQPASQPASRTATQDEDAAPENMRTDSDTQTAESDAGAETSTTEHTLAEGEGDFATTDAPVGTQPVAEPTSGDSFASPIGSPVADTTCSTCAPPQQVVVDQPADLPVVSDLRFTATEWDVLKTTPYLGIAIEANKTPDFDFDGGRVLYHNTDSPVFVDNGYGPHEPQYATAPILDVMRRGGASVTAFHSYRVDTTHTVYWGSWDGNVNPVEIQTDPTDPAIKDLAHAPFHWATMLPTDPGIIAARTGSVAYNTVIVAHGGGSGGGSLTPANVMFNAQVNFDTGAVTNGNLNIYNGPEIWNVGFGGKVVGNIVDVQVDSAVSSVGVSTVGNPRAVEGDMGLAFTGNNGQAIGGGFALQAIGSPSTHVEGILLVH